MSFDLGRAGGCTWLGIPSLTSVGGVGPGTTREGRSVTRDWGPWLVGGGLLLLVGGLLAWTGALSWLGNLPGDIRISSGNTRIYIPITSMVLVSVALNVLLWLFLSLFHR
jgi:hypothetical protein